MTITIPASDAQSTALNTAVTNIGTQMTNVGTASPVYAMLSRMKANAQFALVMHLIGSGHISCASILTNETYISGTIPDGQ